MANHKSTQQQGTDRKTQQAPKQAHSNPNSGSGNSDQTRHSNGQSSDSHSKPVHEGEGHAFDNTEQIGK